MYRNPEERQAIFEKALADNIKISSRDGRLVELSWWDAYYWLQHVQHGAVTHRLTGETDREWIQIRNNHILCVLKELGAKDYAAYFGPLHFEGWIRWLKKSAKTAHWDLLARGTRSSLFLTGNVARGTHSVGRFLLRVPTDCPVQGPLTANRNFPPAPIETQLWGETQLLEATAPATISKRSKTLDTMWAHQRGEGPPLAKHDKYARKVFSKIGDDADRISVQEDAKLFALPTDLQRFSAPRTLSVWQTPLLCLPASVGQLQSLQILQLYMTLITHLPPEVGSLRNLTHLNLSGSTGLQSLPAEVVQLSNLVSLNLSYCVRLTVDVALLSKLSTLTKLSLPPHTTEAEWTALKAALPDCTVRVMRYNPQRRVLFDAAS